MEGIVEGSLVRWVKKRGAEVVRVVEKEKASNGDNAEVDEEEEEMCGRCFQRGR